MNGLMGRQRSPSGQHASGLPWATSCSSPAMAILTYNLTVQKKKNSAAVRIMSTKTFCQRHTGKITLLKRAAETLSGVYTRSKKPGFLRCSQWNDMYAILSCPAILLCDVQKNLNTLRSFYVNLCCSFYVSLSEHPAFRSLIVLKREAEVEKLRFYNW